MKSFGQLMIYAALPLLPVVSCEIVDDDPLEHVDERRYISLNEVAEVFAGIPLELCHLQEVHDAVSSSSGNGYDEEYTMVNLFFLPGFRCR